MSFGAYPALLIHYSLPLEKYVVFNLAPWNFSLMFNSVK